jgi:hypothetical protein
MIIFWFSDSEKIDTSPSLFFQLKTDVLQPIRNLIVESISYKIS